MLVEITGAEKRCVYTHFVGKLIFREAVIRYTYTVMTVKL